MIQVIYISIKLYFLIHFTEVLRGTVASALASITFNNMSNQILASTMGALKLIVDLMQDREFGIRYKASLAIEALAINNVDNQKQFLSKNLNVQKPLNELMEVKQTRENEKLFYFFLQWELKTNLININIFYYRKCTMLLLQ